MEGRRAMSKELKLARIIVSAYFNNRNWKAYLQALEEEDKKVISKGFIEIGERMKNESSM